MLLILVAVMVVLIAGISVFAPRDTEDDPRPSTDNHGPQGAKAAYLTLEALGRKVSRWDKPLSSLGDLDAQRTTLVLAEPVYSATDRDALKTELTKFLERGGRVLTTGYEGALLLPDGATAAPEIFSVGLCESTPEGQSELARAGSVEMRNAVRWSAAGPRFRVDQRCNGDGVVAHYAVGQRTDGAGEVVWWSSADPMTNAELKHDGDLRLLLASVGADRDVIFDEALHSTAKTMGSATRGLPLTWLALQAAALFGLLVLSFSRRRGPIRVPVTLPRSSPVEFATSMGDLYEKAHATSAATEAARRRLLRVLTREAGLSQAVVAQGAPSIAAALQLRLGGDWQPLGEHLRTAEEAATEPLSGRSSLALVRALSEDAAAVRAALAPRVVSARQVKVEAAEERELAGTRD
jgi:hypothetical protein